MISNVGQMHSEKQINEIREGVRLLKSKKKKTLAIIENSNENNSCFKRSESLKSSTITPITEIRSEYLKILSEICNAVPFLDLEQSNIYRCINMSPESLIDVLSQAIFHALFSRNRNLETLAAEDKVNLTGHTIYIIKFLIT